MNVNLLEKTPEEEYSMLCSEELISKDFDPTKKSFRCEFSNCNKKFSTKGNLKFHIMNIHDTCRKFPCPFPNCRKSFVNKCKLTTHLNSHINIKPFQCGICGKSFSLKGNLKTHVRIHTGEKPYKCIHENCEASFKAIGQLNDHKKIHTNFKPFKCSTCDKNFRRKSSLKNHMTIHSNLKPYQCSFEGCSKRFKQNSNLLKHMRAIHKNIMKTDSGINLKISTCDSNQKVNDVDYMDIYERYDENYNEDNDEVFGTKEANSSKNNFCGNLFEINFDNFCSQENINLINNNLKLNYEEMDNYDSLIIPGYKD